MRGPCPGIRRGDCHSVSGSNGSLCFECEQKESYELLDQQRLTLWPLVGGDELGTDESNALEGLLNLADSLSDKNKECRHADGINRLMGGDYCKTCGWRVRK